ncbi:MAG: zinc ribbon domain-containing protein [Anaerolineae bacterium]|nr:zinc ribbon domain-containing protein [Anaerolineae bacterium]
MPIYTYRCRNCGFEFTQMQTFSDQPLTRCSECHKRTLERVLQLSPIIFKGAGWYSTDHRFSSGQTRRSDKGRDKAEGSPREKSKN